MTPLFDTIAEISKLEGTDFPFSLVDILEERDIFSYTFYRCLENKVSGESIEKIEKLANEKFTYNEGYDIIFTICNSENNQKTERRTYHPFDNSLTLLDIVNHISNYYSEIVPRHAIVKLVNDEETTEIAKKITNTESFVRRKDLLIDCNDTFNIYVCENKDACCEVNIEFK